MRSGLLLVLSSPSHFGKSDFNFSLRITVFFFFNSHSQILITVQPREQNSSVIESATLLHTTLPFTFSLPMTRFSGGRLIASGRRFTSKQELVQMIENYIRYYNTRRVQRNLGVLTPMEKYQLCLTA